MLAAGAAASTVKRRQRTVTTLTLQFLKGLGVMPPLYQLYPGVHAEDKVCRILVTCLTYVVAASPYTPGHVLL